MPPRRTHSKLPEDLKNALKAADMGAVHKILDEMGVSERDKDIFIRISLREELSPAAREKHKLSKERIAQINAEVARKIKHPARLRLLEKHGLSLKKRHKK